MKTFIKNTKALEKNRRELRKNMTPQEVILWSILKGKNFKHKFRRQFSIDKYILDFYCPEKKLAIEIDGSQHLDSNKDLDRDKFLSAQGIKIVRFWNKDINTNVDGVCQVIESFLDGRG